MSVYPMVRVFFLFRLNMPLHTMLFEIFCGTFLWISFHLTILFLIG